jgi:hypothetical protein
MSKWIKYKEKKPQKDGYYKCLCMGFKSPIKCKFKKAKLGPKEWYFAHFIHKKRCPFVIYWGEKEMSNKHNV